MILQDIVKQIEEKLDSLFDESEACYKINTPDYNFYYDISYKDRHLIVSCLTRLADIIINIGITNEEIQSHITYGEEEAVNYSLSLSLFKEDGLLDNRRIHVVISDLFYLLNSPNPCPCTIEEARDNIMLLRHILACYLYYYSDMLQNEDTRSDAIYELVIRIMVFDNLRRIK